MTYGDSKRIVVVKDIPSNVIEEAIFILKREPGAKISKDTPGAQVKPVITKDFLLKEAESIINGYINENKLLEKYGEQKNAQTKTKYSTRKVNLIINSVLVGSIALLVFIISRLF